MESNDIKYSYENGRIKSAEYNDALFYPIYEYPNGNMVLVSGKQNPYYLILFVCKEDPSKFYVYDAAHEQERANTGFKGLELKAIKWSIDLWIDELMEYTVDEVRSRNRVEI